MTHRILVVDGEPAVTDLLAYNLRKAHYDIFAAADGRAALRLAQESKPDLILFDLMIPEVDGLDVCRELAMKAASEKASALAQAAGADSDCVLNISESSWSYFNGHNGWYGGNNQNLWTQNAVQNVAPAGGGASAGDDSPVSAGQISIRAEVSLTFALK